MAIPSRQIGWGTTDNLLWEISKQIESIGCVVACGTSSTGTSGTSGLSGLSGTSGTSGVVGTSGTSGVNGLTCKSYTLSAPGIVDAQFTGTTCSYAVVSGNVAAGDTYTSCFIENTLTIVNGTITDNGICIGASGTSGTSGASGTAGVSGTSGISGTSGLTGTAGTSGVSGTSGASPVSYYGSFIFDTETALTSAITNPSSTATINVTSTTGFGASGYIKVGTEVIGYTGKTATSFTGITRGVATSSAASHSIGTLVNQAQWVSALTPAQVIIDETDLSNGVTLSGVGDVTVANAGTYNLQFSIQFENFGNDYADVVAWFRLNGTAIPKTASHSTISQSHAGAPGALIMTVNIFYTCVGGEVFSLMWQSNQGTAAITSIASNGTVPQSPGVIFTVNKIA